MNYDTMSDSHWECIELWLLIWCIWVSQTDFVKTSIKPNQDHFALCFAEKFPLRHNDWLETKAATV